MKAMQIRSRIVSNPWRIFVNHGMKTKSLVTEKSTIFITIFNNPNSRDTMGI